MQKRSADPKQNRDMEEGKAVDVVDNGDHFTVKADLPGFDKKDIKIGMTNGVLTLNVPNKQAAVEEKKDEVKQIEVK